MSKFLKNLFKTRKLGTFSNVPVYVDRSIYLFYAMAILPRILMGFSFWDTIFVVFQLTVVMGCILLHEFGHIFAARHYGIQCKKVLMWIFGGLAMLKSEPKTPKQQILISLAGPAVNIALCLLSLPFAFFNMLTWFCVTNLVLAIFNLIPIGPLDGGQIALGLMELFGNNKISALRKIKFVSVMSTIVTCSFFLAVGLFWPVVILTMACAFGWCDATHRIQTLQKEGDIKKYRQMGDDLESKLGKLTLIDALSQVTPQIIRKNTPGLSKESLSNETQIIVNDILIFFESNPEQRANLLSVFAGKTDKCRLEHTKQFVLSYLMFDNEQKSAHSILRKSL